MATQFTPFYSTLGGLLIGTASVLMMLGLGRIAGVSGRTSIAASTVSRSPFQPPVRRIASSSSLRRSSLILICACSASVCAQKAAAIPASSGDSMRFPQRQLTMRML